MLFDAPRCLAQVTEYRDRDHQCQGANQLVMRRNQARFDTSARAVVASQRSICQSSYRPLTRYCLLIFYLIWKERVLEED